MGDIVPWLVVKIMLVFRQVHGNKSEARQFLFLTLKIIMNFEELPRLTVKMMQLYNILSSQCKKKKSHFNVRG